MCTHVCVYPILKHENSEIKQSIHSGRFTIRFISACCILALFYLLPFFTYFSCFCISFQTLLQLQFVTTFLCDPYWGEKGGFFKIQFIIVFRLLGCVWGTN